MKTLAFENNPPIRNGGHGHVTLAAGWVLPRMPDCGVLRGESPGSLQSEPKLRSP